VPNQGYPFGVLPLLGGVASLEFCLIFGYNFQGVFDDQSEIDRLMPESINVSATCNTHRDPGRTDQRMRNQVADKQETILSANGADYGILSDYMKQQQGNPEKRASRAMRYFFLTQKRKDRMQIKWKVTTIWG
jgi:hypothetical protein